MNHHSVEVLDSFTPELMSRWNTLLSNSNSTHDLGQTPEWCSNWAQTYHTAYEKLLLIQTESSVFPFMLRKMAGNRALLWVGQSRGMESDYSGGSGSYDTLLNALIKLDNWDTACLKFPHWQQENNSLIKALTRYEKYLWRIDSIAPSIVIDLPATFDEWLAQRARTPRVHARRAVTLADQGELHFEILQGKNILPAVDTLIANNQRNWNTFATEHDVAFLKQTIRDLEHNPNLFLARLSNESSTPACCLGYISGSTVFIHTAGISRTHCKGATYGDALYSLLIREMIHRKMHVLDFCPGLEEYKFRLGGHWTPNHRIILARNRTAYCRHRMNCSLYGFSCACRELLHRKLVE